MEYSSDDVGKFIKLVQDMRSKQKTFLSDRSQNNMIIARAAEQQVDGYLNHFLDINWHQPEPTVIQKPLL
jgi:hypothetical protein